VKPGPLAVYERRVHGSGVLRRGRRAPGRYSGNLCPLNRPRTISRFDRPRAASQPGHPKATWPAWNRFPDFRRPPKRRAIAENNWPGLQRADTRRYRSAPESGSSDTVRLVTRTASGSSSRSRLGPLKLLPQPASSLWRLRRVTGEPTTEANPWDHSPRLGPRSLCAASGASLPRHRPPPFPSRGVTPSEAIPFPSREEP
jgi:hypothetical protein